MTKTTSPSIKTCEACEDTDPQPPFRYANTEAGREAYSRHYYKEHYDKTHYQRFVIEVEMEEPGMASEYIDAAIDLLTDRMYDGIVWKLVRTYQPHSYRKQFHQWDFEEGV